MAAASIARIKTPAHKNILLIAKSQCPVIPVNPGVYTTRVARKNTLERLEVFDQRALVIIAQRRFLLEIAGAEVVASIDHIIGAFT